IVQKPLDEFVLALSVGPSGEPHLYEASGRVDLEAQAYSGDETLTLIGEIDGEQVLAESVSTPGNEFGELVGVGAGEGLTVPAVQAELDDESADEAPADSPEHLAVEAWARGLLEPGSLRTSVRRRPGDAIVADIGPVSRPLAAAGGVFAARWALERHAIDHPRTTAFKITTAGTAVPDDELGQLELGDLRDAFEVFLSAREAFFAALAELHVPTVIGADLTASDA